MTYGTFDPKTVQPLPQAVDLTRYAGLVEDQLVTSSCVANATVSVFEILLAMKYSFEDLSRLHNYYHGRQLHPTTAGVDAGMGLADGIYGCLGHGICAEPMWPFIPAEVNTVPSPEAEQDAIRHQINETGYIQRIWEAPTLTNIKRALSWGYPVLFGVRIKTDFYQLKGPLETQNYQGIGASAGNHAMVIIGYDEATGMFLVENSWGTVWGDKGYAAISFEIMWRDGFEYRLVKRFSAYQLTELEARINGLYLQILDRMADDEGLAYWLSEYQRGVPLRDIARCLYTSPEYESEGDWLAGIYRSVLGREPDEVGYSYWITSTLSPVEIEGCFAQSPEFAAGW
jgi:hypothetical protein